MLIFVPLSSAVNRLLLLYITPGFRRLFYSGSLTCDASLYNIYFKHMRAVIGFILISLLSCNKDNTLKPGFLPAVAGQENAVQWETVTTTWDQNTGKAELHANSYAFDQCVISLNNVVQPCTIGIDSDCRFYYTDGVDFIPYTASGTLIIKEINAGGTLPALSQSRSNNHNSYLREEISGDFGATK